MTATTPQFRSPAPSDQPSSSIQQSELTVDVAIVGGGIVGLTLAVALAPSGMQIAVIEAQTAVAAASRQRAYAFSLTSADIFKGLGLWPQIGPYICHFDQVQLSDGNYGKVVRFLPSDLGTDAVYYGAEHGVLMAALQGAIAAFPNIHYLCLATLGTTHNHRECTVAEVSTPEGNVTVRSPLFVAADGKGSSLRQRAGIGSVGWRYRQSCVTTVLEPEHSHQNTAYERFWPSGPFAILPLPGQRCQVVWTAPHAEAEAVLHMPEAEFMAELEQRYGSQMGRLKRLTAPAMFPVQLMQCDRYVLPRLALVGDAAHSCHPVGGQGLNMGIRDAAALAEVLTAAHQQGQDLGSLTVLRRYERWRRLENWVILSFTDGLTRIFSNRLLPIVVLRRSGLWVLSHVSPLKRLALRLMTGRLGRVPRLAQLGRQGYDSAL
ncbi:MULTISPECIES: FAD-dependent hydroxylase [Cyanophyceae]|uniref:FAD-dependent hydroxylase n=1 Tax=Leptolyngbya subtilissima DQ-A4 TaxID=2933933 RepID=A0ABV0KA28_9CYAN|nr:FAD-dependent hydroxylase [Nodosilinea sp. FACHB-141]MBD2114995.1 FAD-dependent hydroxylase [Nodosilinea sp. FACHB-141]